MTVDGGYRLVARTAVCESAGESSILSSLPKFIASSSSGRTPVSETVGRGSNPREASSLLPLRLTVGQRPLTPLIVVRIHEGQHERLESIYSNI